MRLLIYGPNYAPEKTGTGKYTAEMAEWFVAQGHEVHVICGPPHYPEWKLHEGFRNKHGREERAGVQVRRVPMYIPPPGGVSGKRRIRMESSFTLHAARPWFRWLFSKRKPNVVIAVCPPMQVGLPAWLYTRLRRVPWVYHIQDLQVDAAIRLGVIEAKGFAGLLYRVEEFFLHHADRVSTITPGMRDRILAKGVAPDKMLSLPNWSDIKTMRPAKRENTFREKLGVAPEDVVLLYAGNMGRKQGLEMLLEAARHCRDDPRLHFVLVGDGAARPELQASATDLPNVRFMPLQPLEQVPEMLNAADVHLVVQRREAGDLVMPSKLTNILSVGGCALATAEPDTTLHAVLTEHDAGLAVRPENVEALVAGIRDLVGDSAARARLGSNARAYAEEHLDREAILRRFKQELEALRRGQTHDRRDELSPPAHPS